MSEGYPQCVEFLQWALPRLGMQWAGFRKVRRQVCRRLCRRCAELGLSDLSAYGAYLDGHPEEWAVLEGLTHITISRFNRDRGVFELLRGEVLPDLAHAAGARPPPRAIEAWSAGCASGEEPYTLAMTWALGVADAFPGVRIQILATDVDAVMLGRARRGCYGAGSLRELPRAWRARAFVEHDGSYCLHSRMRAAVRIEQHDIRSPAPGGPFDLVMCRNLAFTYFDREGQETIAESIAGVLRPGGALVIGKHESLPPGVAGIEPWSDAARVYRRV